ncbi:hypothetical protein ACFLY4_00785 [Chloroflexota bacterium]
MNPTQIDVIMDELDGLLMLVFNSAEISNFFIVDRRAIGSNTIIYKIRSIVDHIPNLGQIQLTSIGESTLFTKHKPDWPNLEEELLYRSHIIEITGQLPDDDIETLTLMEERTSESVQKNSYARKIQIKAWKSFEDLLRKEVNNLDRILSRRGDPEKPDDALEGGSTLRTSLRFDLFQRIKNEHPDWTQDKVAQQATDEDGIQYSAETVRNAYRKMGVKWERGDRTR